MATDVNLTQTDSKSDVISRDGTLHWVVRRPFLKSRHAALHKTGLLLMGLWHMGCMTLEATASGLGHVIYAYMALQHMRLSDTTSK